MTSYPESGVKLIVDTSDAQSALDDLLSSLNDIQGQEYSATVTVDADTSGADDALADLPLDGETVDFTVAADVELSGDELPVEGETIDTEVNVEETDTAKKTLSAVETIRNLKIMETVWNIAGTAVDIFGKFNSFAVQPMLALDDAVAKVNATTGNAVPNAEHLIKDIFYDDLGDSIDQVANLVVQAAQLKLPIDEAVRSALTFTHTFSDQNPQQVLDTLNQLVLTGLVPNFKTAGDVLVTAFQNGANKGEDLLTALNNNANAIRDMGLTGPEALSFIKTGLDNGFKSAQDVLMALGKIKQNVTNAAGNQTSDVTKTLNILGIANPAETGEAWSADFFKNVIDGIKSQPGLSDSEKEVLFTNLIGGKQGGKTFSAFLAMSPEDADTIFANVAGAADRAAAEVDNSLSGAIDDFRLAAESAVEDWLSSSAIDLPGKITALKTGLQDALNVLANEGSLSDALTIALKPLGFDDEFQGLESALGNLVIGILQAVAMLQENPLIGNNPLAAAGTRSTIAGMASTQLEFDLKIANPDEVATDIATATSRGLSSDQIAGSVSKVIDALITAGTADSMAQAQTLIDTLKAPIDMNKVPLLANGTPMNVEPVVTDEAITALQTKVNTALEKAPPPDVVDQLSASMGLLDTATNKVSTSSKNSYDPLTSISTATKTMGTNAANANRPLKDTGGALVTVTQSANPAASGLYNVSAALDVIINKASAVGTAADVLATKNTDTGGSAPPPTGSTTTGGGGSPPDDRGLRGFTAATLPFIQGASSGGSSGGNYTAINNNFVQSTAQADRLGFSTAETLRGMANA